MVRALLVCLSFCSGAINSEGNPGSPREGVGNAPPRMKASEAMAGMLQCLEEKPESAPFIAIAKLKEEGRAAGPALARCLEHDNWEVRIEAARTIGYIGYVEAGPLLIKLLHEDNDWRQVFVSIQSLGQLRVAEAVGPLTKLSGSHWYPPVRDAAKKAILVINGAATYESKIDRGGIDFWLEFDEYMLLRVPSTPSSAVGSQQDADHAHVSQKNSLGKEQLAKLAYKREVSSLRVGKDGRSMEKYVATLERVPQVGFKVGDEYLVGSNHGEFGGELVLIDRAGSQTVLLYENTQGIYEMTCGVVAVTGIDHLAVNRGILFKVSQRADGTWKARGWKALPGSPHASSMLANGNLWVDCSNGCVEISPAGDIKMAVQE